MWKIHAHQTHFFENNVTALVKKLSLIFFTSVSYKYTSFVRSTHKNFSEFSYIYIYVCVYKHTCSGVRSMIYVTFYGCRIKKIIRSSLEMLLSQVDIDESLVMKTEWRVYNLWKERENNVRVTIIAIIARILTRPLCFLNNLPLRTHRYQYRAHRLSISLATVLTARSTVNWETKEYFPNHSRATKNTS